MVLTWNHLITLIIILSLAYPALPTKLSESKMGHRLIPTPSPDDWRVIEALAEEHPYIVALLSSMRDYICTGSIINKYCVLTAGNCVTYEPKYVAASTAVYNKKQVNNTIFTVTNALVHGDYIFELKNTNPDLTRLHSNIGLVFVDRPFLGYFINVADLGNVYASELKNKQMIAIGYGGLGPANLVGLQYQDYHQTTCMNPKWYYCVCGIEIATPYKTYISEFGIGGPVLLDSTLVGISAAPCGSLSMGKVAIRYNVFTVVGPYLPWLEKTMKKPHSSNNRVIFRSTGANLQQSLALKHLYLLIMISKIFF